MTSTRELTILANTFHGTEYRSRKTRDELDAIDRKAPWHPGNREGSFVRTEAEERFVRKVARTLCGIDGCKCGTNSFNER
jgi:hypothetical protein